MFKRDFLTENIDRTNDTAEDFDFDQKIDFEEIGVQQESFAEEIDFDKRILGTDIDYQELNDENTETLNDVLRYFEPEIFDMFSKDEKAFVVDLLSEQLTNDLKIKNPPEMIFSEIEDEATLGYFSPEINAIVINSDLLKDGHELRDTVAHEMRHAWQYERINLADEEQTAYDKALQENLNNYVAPEDNYRAYRAQLVEMDAREYANGLVEDMCSWWEA